VRMETLLTIPACDRRKVFICYPVTHLDTDSIKSAIWIDMISLNNVSQLRFVCHLKKIKIGVKSALYKPLKHSTAEGLTVSIRIALGVESSK